MPSEAHERARRLLDGVENGTPADRRWLDEHLAVCPECARQAELAVRTSAALRAFAFEVDPGAALRVNAAVRAEVDRLADRRRLRIAAFAALVLTITGSLAAWTVADWWARQAHVSPAVWQPALAVFWILPSLLLDGVLLFRGRLLANLGEGELL
jgi:anti-sigma factor RsiW